MWDWFTFLLTKQKMTWDCLGIVSEFYSHSHISQCLSHFWIFLPNFWWFCSFSLIQWVIKLKHFMLNQEMNLRTIYVQSEHGQSICQSGLTFWQNWWNFASIILNKNILLQNWYQPIVLEHPLIGLITNPKTLQARLSLKSPATHNAKYPSTTKRTSEIAPFAFYVLRHSGFPN